MASADTVDAAFTGLTLAAAFSLASFYDRRGGGGARDAAYVCVECGHDLGAPLMRANKIGQVTLTRCGRCRAVADKYVEHEHVAVALSLVLHRTQAYRHLLFNSPRWGGAAAPIAGPGGEGGGLVIVGGSAAGGRGCVDAVDMLRWNAGGIGALAGAASPAIRWQATALAPLPLACDGCAVAVVAGAQR